MTAEMNEDDCNEYYFGIPFKKRVSVDAAKPAPKFKVGDRVRFTDEVMPNWFFKAGETGSIVEAGDGHNMGIVVQCDSSRSGDTAYVSFEHIELATTPPFAIGDRVKLNRHFGPHAHGDQGVVYGVLSGERFVDVGVSMDPWKVYSVFPVECLELVADDCAERNEQQPKFKVGDVVVCLKSHDPGCQFTKGSHYRVRDVPWDGWVSVVSDDSGDENGIADKNFELAAPCPQDNAQSGPSIVARVVDGQPRPSNIPYVHSSAVLATQEAERLAKNNPGQEFAVYQRVAGRVAEVEYNMKEVA